MASSSSSNDMFGWDLTYKLVENQIKSESDVLIAVVHWCLISKGFRCVGIGDDKTLTESDTSSELLPDGWNSADFNYALRYIHGGQLYILHGIQSEGSLILNLLQVQTLEVSNIAVHLENTVKEIKGPINKMVPEIQNFLDRLRKELIQPVFEGTKKEIQTQTPPAPEPSNLRDPLAVGPPRRGGYNLGYEPGFGNVGRGDLDPLGRLGGGMIFPGGQLPFPGAPGSGLPRFDPFGPINPNRNNPRGPSRFGPDNDQFKPPGNGFDDFYM